MDQASLLLRGDRKLGIIGMGYVGYSSMVCYLRKGIRCAVTDFDEKRLGELKAGRYPPKNRFLYWKNMAELNYVFSEERYSVVSPDEIVSPEIGVYLVGLPFDYRSSKSPSDLLKGIGLFSSLKKIPGDPAPIVIFECTLKPYTMERMIIPAFREAGLEPGKDFILAYAPRKDWFFEELESDRDGRLCASLGAGGQEAVVDVLRLVHDRVVHSASIISVEVAECLENAIRYTGNALINQLIFAYPDVDLREAVRLAKGPGGRMEAGMNAGFELLLASQFLVDAARNPGYLTILNNALSSHFSIQQAIVELLKRRKVAKVAVLGLLSHENKAEYDSSPPFLLPNLLRAEGFDVKVHDPYLPKSKIRRLTGCKFFDFPGQMGDMEAVLLLTPHTSYGLLSKADLIKNLSACRLVLDNTGLWEKYAFTKKDGIDFRVVGESRSLI